MSVFMLGAGGYTALKAEQFFYPNRHQEKAVDRERDERVYDNMWASGENAKKEQVIEAAVEKIPVVTIITGIVAGVFLDLTMLMVLRVIGEEELSRMPFGFFFIMFGKNIGVL